MTYYEKFQELLKKLFQFDASELDFGIYRILNFKREQIEKFITSDLRKKVDNAFKKHKGERYESAKSNIYNTKSEVIKHLGENALKPTGELKEEFKDTPAGKEYILAKLHYKEVEKLEEIQSHVFNDLYNFFSLFYQDGDFVSQYRYSIKGHKYAIPYNGEEVKLYWANYDQYYVKTGILFRDYSFNAGEYKVTFRIVEAEEELGSNKATKERFFIPDNDNFIEQDENIVILRFQYRELTNTEVSKYDAAGGSNTSKQEKINQKSYDEILKVIKDIKIKGALSKEKNEKPLLLYHLNRFAAKNSRDYFIHKNLKKFLSEQLDYYIKSEVISIDTIENEQFLDKHITRAKMVREIAGDIIEFLSQIENFQKRLWEKKKFVLKTEYVVTTDRIPKEFYDEIFKNKEQKKEWKEFGFEIPKSSDEFKSCFLPVDTKHFTLEFKEKMLEKITVENNLDDFLNGLLIKSENWQALNLLIEKYKEKVQTIYIDPPFNLGTNADFLYNVNYKDSTWIDLLLNRFEVVNKLIDEKGSLFIRCDYNGNMFVRLILNHILGNENFKNEIILSKSNRLKTEGKKFLSWHDSLLLYNKNSEKSFFNHITLKREEEEWRSIDNDGETWSIIPERIIKYLSVENIRYNKDGKPTSRSRYILGQEITPRQGRRFPSQEIIEELEKNKLIRMSTNGNPQMKKPDVIYMTDNWTDVFGYSKNWDFSTENAEIIMKRAIDSTSKNNDIILDYFLGCGSTCAVAKKMYRKFIGVEMANYFDSHVLPRLKSVLHYDDSGISNDEDVKINYNETKAGGSLKYQILEQYEDVLDNLELKENMDAEGFFKDEYLLKYFIDFETRENNSLLNIDKLKKPFEYKIKVNFEEVGEPLQTIVDIPETFNYLLGLKVNKFKARELNGNRYYFILGEKNNKIISVVWRNYDDEWPDEDLRKDKEFIQNELKDWQPHIIYVNGHSILTTKFFESTVEIKYIEPEFKKLMF
ncbi:MAG: site-specific DNA-methyltransferase [Ignavibacteria bacterium]|nr:site-specific DNA-methyltransferase [Ignavibacteria bacterium]